jgi:hypothetical protein
MKEIKVMPFQAWIDKFCKYELVGLQERIAKAYNYQFEDGMVEKLMLPPLKAAR